MNEIELPNIDWIHLSNGTEARSLWDSLHDGELCSSTSDILNRTIQLRFQIGHLIKEKPDLDFLFLLHSVSSVRATVSVRWPGEFVRPAGISREEESRLIQEYQSKWREESLGWREFELSLASNPLQIDNAEMASGSSGNAMRIQGTLDGNRFDDAYCEIVIRYDALAITTSENQSISFEDFNQLGHDYWASFAARKFEE